MTEWIRHLFVRSVTKPSDTVGAMTATRDLSHWSVGAPEAGALAHIPGISGPPVVGNTIELLRDPNGFFERLVAQHGPVCRSHILGDWNVSLVSAEANEFVMRDTDKVFSNEQGWGLTLEKLFPRGLMLLDFDAHRVDRRALATAFSQKALATYIDALGHGISREAETWQGTVRFYPTVKELALKLAAESFVGVAWGSDEAKRINDAFISVVEASVAFIRAPLPLTRMRAGVDGRAFLAEYFTAECERRRTLPEPGADIFSQFAIATTEDGSLLEVGQVVDHIIFLMMAAHDTITASATSTLYFLAKNPSWQRALRDEIVETLGAVPPAVQLSYEQLPSLKLTEQVFKESLRLRPPVTVLPRRAMKDFSFGGFDIPAGTRVGVSMYHTGNNPEYWEDAARFDPTRFSPENEASHVPYAWAPFGGGAHKCIGLRFADMQMKLLLANTLTRYEVVVPPSYDPGWKNFPIQRPKDGLQVEFRPLS